MTSGLPLDNFIGTFTAGREIGKQIGLQEQLGKISTSTTTTGKVDYNLIGDAYAKAGNLDKAIQMKQLAQSQAKLDQDTEKLAHDRFVEKVKPLDDLTASLLKEGRIDEANAVNEHIFKTYPDDAKKYLMPLEGANLQVGEDIFKLEAHRDAKTGQSTYLGFTKQGKVVTKDGVKVADTPEAQTAALAGVIPESAKTPAEIAAANENKIIVIEERAKAQAKLDTEKRLKTIAEKFDKKPGVLALKTSINQSAQLKSLLASQNPQLTEAVKGQIARQISGEKGVLTEQDITRVGGSQALYARFNQNLTKLKSGKFTKENLDGFKKALSEIEELQNHRYVKELNGYARDNATELDVPLEDVQKRLSGAYSLVKDKPKGTAKTPSTGGNKFKGFNLRN